MGTPADQREGTPQGRHGGTVALVKADRRSCRALPLQGGGHGHVSAPAVLATSEADVRAALAWLPGRILVLAEGALEPVCLALVVHSVQRATLSGVVLLGEGTADTRPLAEAGGLVPIVSVDRPSDRRCVVRAARLVLDVRDETDGSVGLGHARSAERA